MAIQSHNRSDMALRQLETALSLYPSGDDDFSVIILAASADEIFGQLVAANGQDNSLESLKKSVVALRKHLNGPPLDPSTVADRANRARNYLKHWRPGQPMIVSFDAREEAKDMLNRAIENYWSLNQLLSPAMERFERESMAAV